ncbi:MAG TPA: hypothetical protein VGQ87_01885 [Patescibacteria group bacterium]|jgi:hypothetical protein|nr:hypothetical protein [Patescibacteria group bacterium]
MDWSQVTSFEWTFNNKPSLVFVPHASRFSSLQFESRPAPLPNPSLSATIRFEYKGYPARDGYSFLEGLLKQSIPVELFPERIKLGAIEQNLSIIHLPLIQPDELDLGIVAMKVAAGVLTALKLDPKVHLTAPKVTHTPWVLHENQWMTYGEYLQTVFSPNGHGGS